MGGAASIAEAADASSLLRSKMLEIMAVQANLPEDASDLQSMEDCIAEVQKLRKFIKQCNEDYKLDSNNRCVPSFPSPLPPL